jgi:glutamine phosphoribosylpyrophosphate amidotransferase
MERAVKKQNKRIVSFCKACFTGHYPTGDISTEVLSQIETERNNQKSKTRNG